MGLQQWLTAIDVVHLLFAAAQVASVIGCAQGC